MSLTDQIKLKSVSLECKTVFCLVGEKKCKNELIASHLYHSFGNECLIFKDINMLVKNSNQNRLVLLDWPSKHLEEMIVELATYNAQKRINNPVVLHSVPSKHKFSKTIISKGIHGVFYQHDTLNNFTKGVLAVLNGALWFPRETMVRYMRNEIKNVSSETNAADKLTPRQVEILSMIAVGQTNKEISEKLYISPNTVKNHLYVIFKKINVTNRIHAALWAAVNL